MAVDFLRKIPFLSSLSRQDLRRVYRLGRILTLEAGDTIFSKAQAGQHMFVEFKGRVEAITAQVWTIGGQTVWVTERTEIKGGIQVGDFVEVHAVAGEDGVLLAHEIKVED